MLWLGLHFPSLAHEVFTRADVAAIPFAVTEGEGRRQLIASCNDAARRAGIRPGLTLGAAHVLAHDLRMHARDIQAEQQALTQTAAWAAQFTPALTLAPQAVLLEIEGSQRLFGGLDALLGRVRDEIRALGYHVQIATAPTPLAALWLARADRAAAIDELDDLAAALAPVPVRALDLPNTMQAALDDLGVHRLGDVLRLPRDGLTRRFGPMLVQWLDRALGRAPDPRMPFLLPPRFVGRITLSWETNALETILFAAHRLLHELQGFLRAHDRGVQRLEFSFTHSTSPTTDQALGLVAPARDPKHLLRLLREHLQRLPLRAPVAGITLTAVELRPWPGQNASLLRERQHSDDARLIEHLQARLGADAVCGIGTAPEHRPERAWRTCTPGESSATMPTSARPAWLLPEPVPLRTRNGTPRLDGVLTLEQGPERIESGWWDGCDVRRDYFLARHERGARYWVYREHGSDRWFLHGIFA